MAEPVRTSRQYVSPLRREKAAQTRERIVTAGCDLLQRSSIRDWGGLTIRAVAERAGVNERTVYRCFVNERGLRDAVMHRLEEQAGIDLEGMGLGDISDVTARILTHISAYPREARPVLDPTLKDASRRQREALHKALAQWTGEWAESEKETAAAMFDVLWSVASYERLVVDWQMEDDDAIRVITWTIGLIEEAVRQGRRPSDSTVTSSGTRRSRTSGRPGSEAKAVRGRAS
jgi:AcrR family transcriptional regulator